MYTLYYAPGAASMLPHLVLLQAGVPYTLKRIDLAAGEQHSDSYLALNPTGMVPTLLIDNTPFGEAAALAMLLVERHPETGLAPALGDSARADYLQWMLYLASTLQPAFRQWFHPSENGVTDEVSFKQAVGARIEGAWSRLDAHLAMAGPYMLSDTCSVVDLYTVILMRWSRNMPNPGTNWPHLTALAVRVKECHSWRQLCQIEGLTPWTVAEWA